MKPGLSLLALLACALAAQARLKDTIPLQPGAPVTMTVECCFNNVALPGYVPLDVTIRNDSGEARRWVFEFRSPAYSYGSMTAIESSFTVAVDDNVTRTVQLLVPMGPEQKYNGVPPLQLRVSGYGTDSTSQDTFSTGGANNSDKSAPIAVSAAYGNQVFNGDSTVAGSTFEPGELPADWRGLSGLASIWMAGDELGRISPTQREAVRTWMRAGGSLHLFNTPAPPPDFAFAGLGSMEVQPYALNSGTVAQIAHLLAHYDDRFNISGIRAEPELTEVRPNVPLLLGFMGLFSVIVGPVNFFVLARRRRERLFWTTPLISISASLALFALIVARDGLGGHGVRGAVVCVFPDTQTKIIRQQQVSRTGLLLGSSFETPEQLLLAELTASDSGVISENMSRGLVVDGNRYSGDWFTTRAAQQQGIMAVKPAHEQIALLNAAEVREKNAAPVVNSSFDVPLDHVYFTDERHGHWQATNLVPGARQTMTPAGRNMTFTEHAGERYYDRPGYFIAIGANGAEYIPTLDSIHWSDLPVTYIIPATETP